ncbi:MAG TPA: glutathione binding-like protein [Polyangiaceae bacterium]|nr:glutathione binding-like protein [Polyangiaceae bacterium]
MIDAYAWTTPNGQKLLIALEELGLPHTVKWVNLGKDEQKRPEYLAINPNNKIPAIVDPDGPDGEAITVFESGAVLLYLADKAKKLVMPGGAERYRTMEWMFFNTGGAPLIGQLGYYKLFAKEKEPKPIERFQKETERLLGVLERRLGQSRFLVGDEYSIADVQNFTWPHAARTNLGIDVAPFPHVARWLDTIAARPAVQRGLQRKPG